MREQREEGKEEENEGNRDEDTEMSSLLSWEVLIHRQRKNASNLLLALHFIEDYER